jgi:hypothetical protein
MATTAIQTKCVCGLKSRGTCKNCSRIKMTFLLKNGWDFLKNSNGSNPVRYNYYSKNGETAQQIVEGMMRRFLDDVLITQASRIVQFYENGQLIFEYKP